MGCHATLERCIIAGSLEGQAIEVHSGSEAVPQCCDLYGNEGGDRVGFIAAQQGIQGNISEDPLFCDAAHDDLTLAEDSPCASHTPPNPECDRIGAWPVGCGANAGVSRAFARGDLLLDGIRPNPCRAGATIAFHVPSPVAGSHFRLAVYDPAGRAVHELAGGPVDPGRHVVRWDGADAHGRSLPAGAYVCRLRVGDVSLVRRVLLVR